MFLCTYQPGKFTSWGSFYALTHFLPAVMLTKFLFAGHFCGCGALMVGCHMGVEIVISSGIHVMSPDEMVALRSRLLC